MFVFTNREPLGVIAAVIPWNSQMFLTATKLGPALAAGNTMVLKASEHASAPLLAFGKLVAEAWYPARCGQYHYRAWRGLRSGINPSSESGARRVHGRAGGCRHR
jgi:acyl-CoA reductase-like NAD-dependent aldehyde dehydrogenase